MRQSWLRNLPGKIQSCATFEIDHTRERPFASPVQASRFSPLSRIVLIRIDVLSRACGVSVCVAGSEGARSKEGGRWWLYNVGVVPTGT